MLPRGPGQFFSDPAVPLALVTSPTQGRHVVAKYHLPTGATVNAAAAYATVISDDCKASRCHACFRSTAARRGTSACRGCGFASFCSPACATAGVGHDGVCGALAALHAADSAFDGDTELLRLSAQHGAALDDVVEPAGDKESLRLALACLHRAGVEAQAGAPPPPPSRGVHHTWTYDGDIVPLVAHEAAARRSPRKWRALQSAARFLLKCAAGASVGTALPGADRLDEAHAMRLLLQIKHNSFPVTDPGTGKRVGVGMFPGASFHNHSCVPNACYFADRSGDGEWRIIVRSVAAVPPGAPVTLSYITPYQPAPLRRQLLGFECTCAACKAPGCPFPLLTAGVCTACAGAVVPAEVYHPPVAGAADGAGCACRASHPSPPKSTAAPPPASALGGGRAVCLTCAAVTAWADVQGTERQVQDLTKRAMVLFQADVRAGLDAFTDVYRSKPLQRLHPCHHSVMDVHLAIIAAARQVKDWSAVAAHSAMAANDLRTVTPHDVPRIAVMLACHYRAAHTAARGDPSRKAALNASRRRTVTALSLAFGEEHPVVTSFLASSSSSSS